MSDKLLDWALEEDIGGGDVTSEYFIEKDRIARSFVVAREAGVCSGLGIAATVFRKVDVELEVQALLKDGSEVAAGAILMEVSGSARSILTAERTALNFLQRLSGVASLTAKFVQEVAHTKARILDTRKTTPGYRKLEKAAVLDGGGTNHRMGLYDRAMVKDNHLFAETDPEKLRQRILRLKKERPMVKIELEADRLEQVEAFLEIPGVDYILLDNMENEDLVKAVRLRREGCGIRLEASGGVNLKTVGGIAETGVDFISVGAITHSAGSLDIGLDFVDPVFDGRV